MTAVNDYGQLNHNQKKAIASIKISYFQNIFSQKIFHHNE